MTVANVGKKKNSNEANLNKVTVVILNNFLISHFQFIARQKNRNRKIKMLIDSS